MNDIELILLGVFMFTFIVLALVVLILIARSKLVEIGNVKIFINDDPDQALIVPVGGKLLNTLIEKKSISLLVAVERGLAEPVK